MIVERYTTYFKVCIVLKILFVGKAIFQIKRIEGKIIANMFLLLRDNNKIEADLHYQTNYEAHLINNRLRRSFHCGIQMWRDVNKNE